MLKIAYNGANFSGFAPQNHKNTISQTLQNALARLGIISSIIPAGRTDKGVHALGMIVRFSAPRFWDSQRLFELLLPKLYPNILLRTIKEVPSSFHPRASAKRRRYYYLISPHHLCPFSAPFITKASIANENLARECLQLCLGVHDFALFHKLGTPTKSTIRHIYDVNLRKFHHFNTTYYAIKIEGNAFLRTQIRLLIGAILAVSNGLLSKDNFIAQLECRQKYYTQPLAPNGLYFAKVWY